MLGRAALERDFPTVTAACRAHGIDPVSEPIPVAPGAHYCCGGILADLDGRTSVAGLYAVGEAASTGVHGANRLASNSLTEALITGRRAGDLLGTVLPGGRTAGWPGPGQRAGLRFPAAGPGMSPAARPALAAAMSRQAGVVRDRAGLRVAAATLLDAGPARAIAAWTWPCSKRPACTRCPRWSSTAALARRGEPRLPPAGGTPRPVTAGAGPAHRAPRAGTLCSTAR